MIMTAVLIIASIAIAYWSAPKGSHIKTIEHFPVQIEEGKPEESSSKRPGDWLENSLILSILIVVLGAVWMFNEFSESNPILAISSLNTYNFIFLILGVALHGTPRNFLNAVSKAVPAISGVLIQFPLYGSIAFMMTNALNSADLSPITLYCRIFRFDCFTGNLCYRDGSLFGNPGFLHSFRWR